MYRLFRIQYAGVYIHFSIPLVFLLLGIFLPTKLFSSFCFILLIFVHELGHLLAAHFCSLSPQAIYLYYGIGLCTFEEPPDRRREIICYLGGIALQILLLLSALLVSWLFPFEGKMPRWLKDIRFTLIPGNLIIIVFNLIPIKPLDGWYIWGRNRKSAEREATHVQTSGKVEQSNKCIRVDWKTRTKL